jgi:hypothetical protein
MELAIAYVLGAVATLIATLAACMHNSRCTEIETPCLRMVRIVKNNDENLSG